MSEELWRALKLDAAGLIPAVAQQHSTGEILMLAWMNREAIETTLATGAVTYWSRERKKLWRKGETSGHTQRLVEMRLDCDGDALIASIIACSSRVVRAEMTSAQTTPERTARTMVT